MITEIKLTVLPARGVVCFSMIRRDMKSSYSLQFWTFDITLTLSTLSLENIFFSLISKIFVVCLQIMANEISNS